jgi:hypothetical protein
MIWIEAFGFTIYQRKELLTVAFFTADWKGKEYYFCAAESFS